MLKGVQKVVSFVIFAHKVELDLAPLKLISMIHGNMKKKFRHHLLFAYVQLLSVHPVRVNSHVTSESIYRTLGRQIALWYIAIAIHVELDLGPLC